MERIKRTIEYLMVHIDEYTQEQYKFACQELIENAYENISDKESCEIIVQHIKNLCSLYCYLKIN